MIAAREQLLEKVHTLLEKNKYQEAKLQLQKINKKKSFSIREKIKVCTFYYQMGDLAKALKIAGKEASFEQMQEMSESELGLQMEVARLLHYTGARYSAIRTLQKIEQILQQKNLDIKNINIRYPLYKSIIYRIGFYPDKAISSSIEAMNFYPANSQMFYNSWLNAIDSMLYHDCDVQLETIFKPHYKMAMEFRDNYKGIILRNLSDRARIQKKYQEALDYAEQAVAVFPTNATSVEYAVAIRARGEALAATGELEKAKVDIRHALSLVDQYKHSPDMGIKCLLDLELFELDELSLSEKIALRAHPCYCAYAFYVGKKFDAKKHVFDRWHMKTIKSLNTTNDAWYIDNNQIVAIQYKNKFLELKETINEHSLNLIDCVSGIFWQKDKSPSQIHEIKMRALTAIISSGSLGISLWALIDYIYYQEPISFQYGEGRLKAILTDLKKMNIKSYRKNNFYFSDIPKRTAIILPMDSSTAMPWLPFQINHPENFSRMDLEKFYKIHKATANRWLNEWQKLKILTKSNNSFQWA